MDLLVGFILVTGFAFFAVVWVKFFLRPMAREQRRMEEAEYRRFQSRSREADAPPAGPTNGANP